MKSSPPLEFLTYLKYPHPPLQTTALKFLDKARHSVADINWIASDRELVQTLIDVWLLAQETEVACLAEDVITRLLAGDRELPICDMSLDAVRDENALWRRIFRDKDIYESIMASCSLTAVGKNGQASKNAMTTAQGRLLSFLTKIRAGPAWLTQFEGLQAKYSSRHDPWGLLSFAIDGMVDTTDDLMVTILIDFCKNLISQPTQSTILGMSPRDYHARYVVSHGTEGDIIAWPKEPAGLEIDILRLYGRHEWCMSYYIYPSTSTASWVTGYSAQYLSAFARHYPHLLIHSPQIEPVLQKLQDDFDSKSARQWASGGFSPHDLLVLPSLPQRSLRLGSSKHTIINLIPPAFNQPPIINALAECFGSGYTNPQDQTASRLNYFLYLKAQPTLWHSLIQACETISLLDSALAAHTFITRIANAHWRPLSSTLDEEKDKYALPTKTWLLNTLAANALPTTGIEALLLPGAKEHLLPYLFRPAIMFSGVGDESSAAWQVARAKHELLQLIYRKMKDLLEEEDGDVKAMLKMFEERIRAGPLGTQAGVGGEVVTMGR